MTDQPLVEAGLRCPAGVFVLDQPDALEKIVRRESVPSSVGAWQALAEGLLTDKACAFHRNVEISSHYAWLYRLMPSCFKWTGMAALASHHVRLALFPLRLDTDRSGYVNIEHSLGRRRSLMIADVNAIRETNNAIFNDIFWVHLAYITAENGIKQLRSLLGPDPYYAPMLAGFETIDRGRQMIAEPSSSPAEQAVANDLVWQGTLQLLRHEQSALVQPHFDRLSCAFARLLSIGSVTSFEARGLRREVAFFTSFYLYSLTYGMPQAARARAWPRMTRYDDRWSWLVASVVPRFRRYDAQADLLDAGLRHILEQAKRDALKPCVLPPRREPARRGSR